MDDLLSAGNSPTYPQGYEYNFDFANDTSRIRNPFDPLLDLLGLNGIQELFGSSDTLDSGNPFGGSPFEFNPLASGSNSGAGSGNSFSGGNFGGLGEI